MSVLSEIGLSEVIIAIISALGAGGLSFVVALKKNKRDDFAALIKTYSDDNARLREEISKLSERIDELEIQNLEQSKRADTLQTKLILLETAHQDLPFPQWLKNTDGTMLALNKAYEDMFLVPNGFTANDYIGKTDFDIWPEDVAIIYQRNDHKIKTKSKRYYIGEEPIHIKGSDISEDWKVIKYGRFIHNTCVGVAGIAMPVNPTNTA